MSPAKPKELERRGRPVGHLIGAGVGVFCAAVSFIAAFQANPISNLLSGISFSLFAVLWYQCLPGDFFTRPLSQLARGLPAQTPRQASIGLAAVVLLFTSLLTRWIAGI